MKLSKNIEKNTRLKKNIYVTRTIHSFPHRTPGDRYSKIPGAANRNNFQIYFLVQNEKLMVCVGYSNYLALENWYQYLWVDDCCRREYPNMTVDETIVPICLVYWSNRVTTPSRADRIAMQSLYSPLLQWPTLRRSNQVLSLLCPSSPEAYASFYFCNPIGKS